MQPWPIPSLFRMQPLYITHSCIPQKILDIIHIQFPNISATFSEILNVPRFFTKTNILNENNFISQNIVLWITTLQKCRDSNCFFLNKELNYYI